MTVSDFVEIISYFTISFSIGFAAGFLMKTFFKSLGFVK